MPHVRDPGKETAEYPAAQRPERISRGMRHAEMVGGGRELTRILKADGRAEREEIHEKRSKRGGPKRRPVDFREKLLAVYGFKILFVHLWNTLL